MNQTTGEEDGLVPGAKERAMRLFYVQLGFLITTFIFTSLRIYCKGFILKKFSLDDWLMFAAAALYVPYGSLAIYGVSTGRVSANNSLSPTQKASISLRSWYICEVLYAPLTILIRASIAIFLLRIATQPIHRKILLANIWIICFISIAYFFIMVFQCEPISYFWEQVLGPQVVGKCVDRNVVPDATIVHSVISAVSDWTVGLLPVFILWNVKINRRTKVSIAFMLSLGVVAGGVILVRIPFLSRVPLSPEFLTSTLDIATWSLLEPAIGIIAGTLPVLRPLFKQWHFGIRPSGASSSRSATIIEPSWQQRHSRKGSGKSNPRTLSDDLDDDEGSETELTTRGSRSTRPRSGSLPHSKSQSKSGWEVDVESARGSDIPPPPPPKAVYIETRINISSHTVNKVKELPKSTDGWTEHP